MSTPSQLVSQTLPAYVYQEYADDDDIQAFVAAYNAGVQGIVNWFATTGLPDYRGLSAPLLDWVLTWLYGLSRTSLEGATFVGVMGPLNTVMLNTVVLNYFAGSSQSFFNITDDVYKRIATWNLYKGDGKRFCMRWLKRRVMRFIVGVNGTDPQPGQPGFVVGAENTSAISVQVSSNVLTVTISQSVLTALTPVTAGILQTFQEAFQGGALDLPLQYTSYVVDITA